MEEQWSKDWNNCKIVIEAVGRALTASLETPARVSYVPKFSGLSQTAEETFEIFEISNIVVKDIFHVNLTLAILWYILPFQMVV